MSEGKKGRQKDWYWVYRSLAKVTLLKEKNLIASCYTQVYIVEPYNVVYFQKKKPSLSLFPFLIVYIKKQPPDE